MERADFERAVAEALDGIPPEFARYLDNVAVVIEDEPSGGLLRSLGIDPARATLFGLYQGVPLSQRPHDFAGHLPDKITLFAGPLTRACRTHEALERQIATTVVHEIAHFFGLDDAHIRKLGY